jgi:4'-phosphopantetheinyl transferase
VRRGREIGVDLERVCPNAGTQGVAERFFSPFDAAALRTVPSDQFARAFLSCWTRREAYLKARGTGLLGADHQEREGLDWVVRELTPAPGYVGALAVEGDDWQLSCWESPTGTNMAPTGRPTSTPKGPRQLPLRPF